MIRALIVVAALIAASPRAADACSCDVPPPPCEAFQRAAVVFVGKVTAIKEGGGGSQEATFAITEKLKGGPADTEVIAGGGMCGTVFQQGKTYIVYASGSGPMSSSLCGRTATIDRAKADLAYARTVGKRTKAILEGAAFVQDTQGTRTNRANIEIVVRDTKFKARTDKAGRYMLELPPGKYTLDVLDPKARVPVDQNEVVTLNDANACARRDIAMVWNGRVRGTLRGVDGKPISGVQVTLVAAGSTRAGNAFTQTDAKGTYEFSGVQAGEYTLVVYSTKGVPTTTYYPGTDDATQARAIKLSQSGVVQKIDFKLLP